MPRLLSNVSLTEQEEAEIKKKVRKMKDPLNKYSELIAPNLVGIKNKKKAILLTLASLFDSDSTRWRINTVLFGPPATGKSKLLTWCRDKLRAGFAGKRTTEAGLIGTMQHNKPKPGILPENDMGVVCIDELDKFDKSDRDGLLECMSDGRITLTGSGVNKPFPANTIILSAINDYDKMEAQLLSRFDFRLEFNSYDRETGSHILRSIENNNEDGSTELQKFLKTIRGFEPKRDIAPGVELIEEWWNLQNIHEVDVRRDIERFVRVALSHARLNLRDPTPTDFRCAIEFLAQESFPDLQKLEKKKLKKGV